MKGGGGDHIWTWILIWGALFRDSFSIFGQDLKTYHYVMLNLSSPRMPEIDGTLGFFLIKKKTRRPKQLMKKIEHIPKTNILNFGPIDRHDKKIDTSKNSNYFLIIYQ
jgi:hypothetical protein